MPDPLLARSSEEVALDWNKSVRQIHRWVSVAFVVTVIANFVALAQAGGMPPPWVTYSPLLPLALLLITGLYLFVLPYANKWRSLRSADVIDRMNTWPARR
jgi:quinol-cytochrome oxidoreductase complex cytochrome b subunit